MNNHAEAIRAETALYADFECSWVCLDRAVFHS
jgi:hypothetical protein